ncbi:DUF5672 family protein [Psychroserpens damuponensis]|uniref:DUF5672 family protein n=1 Tax=Psychroserpens damuponensis TaxID=943936 RepID=UPI0006946784|nr:DUF5672 family protein [Psychroserpens damuponensis]
MLNLENVTLLGVDCVDLNRLICAADISETFINFKSVKLLTHFESSDSRVVKIPQITSIEAYSEFMIKELYKYVDTDFVLVFQYDGFVINPNRWSNNFFDYDYIGAPCFWGMGNGGFSLRSKRLLHILKEEKRIVDYHPEDLKICKTYRPELEAQGITFAPKEIAQKFSVENKPWNGQFGFHNADISLWDSEKFISNENQKEFIDKTQNEKDDSNAIKLSYVVQLYLEDNQSNPLQELIAIYSSYSRDLLKQIHFVFVDDHSPIPVEIPDDIFLNYTLIRVTSDIMWNQGGARNLGVSYAKSERFIVTDLDIIFPENLLSKLVDYKLPNNAVFKFNTISNLEPVRPHVNVFFMTKKVYMKTTGVDEEFCGNYGYEDIFFYHQQKALGTKFYLYGFSNIVHKEHKDSLETQHNSLVRDVKINEQLIADKLEILKNSTNPLDARSKFYLNFEWEVLKEHFEK